MTVVYVDGRRDFEWVLRRFKKKCEKDGILKELKNRRFYEKPGKKRRRKKEVARKRRLKNI